MDSHKSKYHNCLATYFSSKGLYLGKPNQMRINIRKLIEQPTQFLEAQLWTELEQTLTSFAFIDAKARSGLIIDLLRDYSNAEWAWPGNPLIERKEKIDNYIKTLIDFSKASSENRIGLQVSLPPLPSELSFTAITDDSLTQNTQTDFTAFERITTLKSIIASHSKELSNGTEFSFQLVYNMAIRSPVSNLAERTLKLGGPGRPWTRLLNRPEYSRKSINIGNYQGHTDNITSLAITPDGIHAVSGSSDRTTRYWHLDTGQSYILGEHMDKVNCVALTPDGKKVVSAGNDRVVYVWDIEKGKSYVLEGHTDAINSVKINAVGTFVISGSNDKTVRIWDLLAPRNYALIGHEDGEINRDTASNVVKKYQDLAGTLGLSDTISELQSISDAFFDYNQIIGKNKFSGAVLAIDMTIDERWVISGGDDRTLRLWDLESNTSIILETQDKPIDFVVVSDNGKFVFSGNKSNNYVHVWDRETGKKLASYTPVAEGCPIHSFKVTSDCKYALITTTLSGTHQESIKIVDLSSWESEYIDVVLTGPIVAMTPDGKRIVSGATNSTILVWDLQYHTHVSKSKNGKAMTSFSISPDWKKAILCFRKASMGTFFIDMFRTSSGLLSNIFGKAGSIDILDIDTDTHHSLSENTDFNYVMKYLPDSKFVVTVDNNLRLWNTDTGECQTLESDKGGARILSLVPDGTKIIYKSYHQSLISRDINTGEEHILENYENFRNLNFNFLSTTPDGKNAIIVRDFSAPWETKSWLHICDLKTGEGTNLVQETCLFSSLALTPDGRQVLFSTNNGTLNLFNLRTHNLRNIKKNIHEISSLAVTSDGKRAITCSGKNIDVLDIETGLIMHSWTSSYEIGYSVVQRYPLVVTANYSGNLSFWKVENLSLKSPVYVTGCRLWLIGDRLNTGKWDETITVLCGHCSQRFSVPKEKLDIIIGINRTAGMGQKDSPCLNLPDEAWEEPRLLSECPNCGGSLRFNPFIIDNKEMRG